MFTILIPCLKKGFLQSQLHWLSKQTYKDFTVIVMDAYYSENKHQSWIIKKYPFQFHHVSLVHDVARPKRYDLSLKNNLALLSPTNHFVFLSDTHYVQTNFTAVMASAVFSDDVSVCTSVSRVSADAFDPFRKHLDLGGEYREMSNPVFLFNRRLFFKILNGYDEATTSGYLYDSMCDRVFTSTLFSKTSPSGVVYHIEHGSSDNYFGDRCLKPCEKCNSLFAEWKLGKAFEDCSFPYGNDDPEVIDRHIYADPTTGMLLFECPNCGFGGVLNPGKYKDLIRLHKWCDAPIGVLDRGYGRDLGKIYQDITTKVNNNIQAKLAFIKTTY